MSSLTVTVYTSHRIRDVHRGIWHHIGQDQGSMVSRGSTLVAPVCLFRTPSDARKVPAVAVGILLGPIASKFLDSDRWGSAAPDQQGAITLVRASDILPPPLAFTNSPSRASAELLLVSNL